MADNLSISIPLEIDVSKALPSLDEVSGGVDKLKMALDTLKNSNQDSIIPGFVRDMDEQIDVVYNNVEHLMSSRKAIDSSTSNTDRNYNLQNFQNAYNRAIRSVLDLASGLESSKNLGQMISSDVHAMFTASMKPAATQLKAAFNSVAQNLSGAFGNQRQEDIIKTFLGSSDLNKILSTHNIFDGSKGMSKDVMAEYAKAIYSTSVSKLYDQKYVDWDVLNKKTINSVKERLPTSFRKLALTKNPTRSELSKDSYSLTNDESKLIQEYLNAHPFMLREAEQAGLINRYNGSIYWNPKSTRAHVNAFAGNVANMFETGVRGGPSSGIEQIEDESLLTRKQRNSILNKHNNYTMNSEHAARFLDSNFEWLQPTYTQNQKGIGFIAPKGKNISNWTNIGKVTGTARQDAMDFYELDLSAIQNGKAIIPEWNEDTAHEKRPFIRVNRSMMQNMLSKQQGADQFVHNGLNRNEVYVRLPVDELSDYETTPERISAIKAQIAGAMKGPIGIAGLGDYVFNGFTGTHMVLSRKDLIDQIKANPETSTFLTNGETTRTFSGDNAYEKFAKSLAYQKLLRTEGESVQELWGVNPDDIKVVVADMKEITDSKGKKVMLTGNDGMRIVDSEIFPQAFQHRDFGGKGTSSIWNIAKLREAYADRIATEDNLEEGIHKGDLVFPTGGWNGGKLIIPEGTTIIEDASLLKTKNQYAGKSQEEINKIRTDQERKFDILAKTTAEGFQTDVQYISAQEASTLELTDNARDYFRNVGLKMLASLNNVDSLKQMLFSGDDSLSQLVKGDESYLNEAPAKERVRDFRAKITNLMRGGNLILPRGTAQYAMAQAWVPDMLNALIEAGGETPTQEQQAMSLQSFKEKNKEYHKEMSVDDTIAYFAQADSDLMQLFRNPSTSGGNILAGNAAIDKYFQDLSTALGIDKKALYANPKSEILTRMQTMDFDGDTVFGAALRSNSQFREIMLPVLAATADRYKRIKELSGFTDEEQAERAKRQTGKLVNDEGKAYSLDSADDLSDYAINLYKRNAMMGLSHSIALGSRQFDLSETTARVLRDVEEHYDAVSNTGFKTNTKFDPTKEEWEIAGKGNPFYRIFEFARKAMSFERDDDGNKNDVFDYESFARRKIDKLNFATVYDKNAFLADTVNYMFHNLNPEADEANYDWDDIFAHLNELSPIDTTTHAGKFQQAMRDLKQSRAKGEWLVLDENAQQRMRALGANAYKEISQQVQKEINDGTFKGDLEREVQKRYNEIGGGALQLELKHGLTAGYFGNEAIRSEIDSIVERSGMFTPFANMDYIPEVKTEWDENKNKAETDAAEKRKKADELKAQVEKEEQERKEILKLKGKDAYRNVLDNAESREDQLAYIQSTYGVNENNAKKRLNKWERSYSDVKKEYEGSNAVDAIVTTSDKLPPEAQTLGRRTDTRNEPVQQHKPKKVRLNRTAQESELQKQYKEAEEQAQEAEAAVQAYNDDAALIAEIQRVTTLADDQLKNLRVSKNKNENAIKGAGKAESYFSKQAAFTKHAQNEIAAVLDPNNTIMQAFFGSNQANLSAQNHLMNVNKQLGTGLYEDFFSYVQRMGKTSSDSIDKILDKQINKPSKQKQLIDAQKDELEELQKAREMLLNNRNEKGFLPLGSDFNAATPLIRAINIDDNELTTLGDLQQYTIQDIDKNIAKKQAGIQELQAAITSDNEALFESELNDLALKVSPNLAKNSPKVLSAQRLKKIAAAKSKLSKFHEDGLYTDDTFAEHMAILAQLEEQSSVEAIAKQQEDRRQLGALRSDDQYNQLMRSQTMAKLSRYGLDRTRIGRGLASYYGGISAAEKRQESIQSQLVAKQEELRGIDKNANPERWSEVNSQIANLQQESAGAAKDIQNMSGAMGAANAVAGQMSQTFGRLTSMFGRRIFMRLISEVKTFIKQFDQTMTEIQMITLKSDEQMSTLGDGLIEKAKELKVSIQEITQSAATLYRQGLSDEEVNDRLGVISKFSKVSGTKVADATKLITVAMNTGLITNPQVASDIVTALGDNAATNAAQIEKGIEKAGAAAAADGTTFAQLAAMLTAITSTTQIGGNVAGRTLNTIFGRMNKIGTNELIVDENGNKISGSAVAQLLRAQGINMYDEKGNKRSTYDTLYALSQKWESMSDAEQQQMANAIAGTRQYSNFAAIMQGMAEGKVDEYMKLASESEGITDKKYDIYLESLQASLTNLKNTFDDLIHSLSEQGYAQNFIDGISTMVAGLGEFLSILGQVNVTLPVLMALLGAFSGAKFGGIGVIIGAIAGAAGYGILTAAGNQAQSRQTASQAYNEYIGYQKERYESRLSNVTRWDELNNKIKNGENLSDDESREYAKLKDTLTSYTGVDPNQLNAASNAADNFNSAMGNVENSAKQAAAASENYAEQLSKEAKSAIERANLKETYSGIAKGSANIVSETNKATSDYIQSNPEEGIYSTFSNFAKRYNLEYDGSPESINNLLQLASKRSLENTPDSAFAISFLKTVSKYMYNRAQNDVELSNKDRKLSENDWYNQLLDLSSSQGIFGGRQTLIPGRGNFNDSFLEEMFPQLKNFGSGNAQKQGLQSSFESYFRQSGVEEKYITAMAEQAVEDYYNDQRVIDYKKENGYFPVLDQYVVEDVIKNAFGYENNPNYNPTVWQNSYKAYAQNKYKPTTNDKLSNYGYSVGDYYYDQTTGEFISDKAALNQVEEYDANKYLKTYSITDKKGNILTDNNGNPLTFKSKQEYDRARAGYANKAKRSQDYITEQKTQLQEELDNLSYVQTYTLPSGEKRSFTGYGENARNEARNAARDSADKLYEKYPYYRTYKGNFAGFLSEAIESEGYELHDSYMLLDEMPEAQDEEFKTAVSEIKQKLSDVESSAEQKFIDFVDGMANDGLEVISDVLNPEAIKPQLKAIKNYFLSGAETGYISWQQDKNNSFALAADKAIRLMQENYMGASYNEGVSQIQGLMNYVNLEGKQDWNTLYQDAEFGRIMSQIKYDENGNIVSAPEDIMDQITTYLHSKSRDYGKLQVSNAEKGSKAAEAFKGLTEEGWYVSQEARNQALEAEYNTKYAPQKGRKFKNKTNGIGAPVLGISDEEFNAAPDLSLNEYALQKYGDEHYLDQYSDEYLKEILGEELTQKVKENKASPEELRYAGALVSNYQYGYQGLTDADRLAGMQRMQNMSEAEFAEFWKNSQSTAMAYGSGFSGFNELAMLRSKKANGEEYSQSKLDQLEKEYSDYVAEQEAKADVSTIGGALNYAQLQYEQKNKAGFAANAIYQGLTSAKVENVEDLAEVVNGQDVQNWKDLLESSDDVRKAFEQVGAKVDQNGNIDLSDVQKSGYDAASALEVLTQAVAGASEAYNKRKEVLSEGETYDRAMDYLQGKGEEEAGYEAYAEITGNSKLADIVRNNRLDNEEYYKYQRMSTQEQEEYLENHDRPRYKSVYDGLTDYEKEYARQLEQNAALGISGLTEDQRYEGAMDILRAAQEGPEALQALRQGGKIGAFDDYLSGIENVDQIFADLASGDPDKAAKALKNFNEQLDERKAKAATRYSKGAENMATILSKIKKGGKDASEGMAMLRKNFDQYQDQMSAVSKASGKSGKNLDNQTRDILASMFDNISADDIKNMTEEQLSNLLDGSVDSINEGFADSLQSMLDNASVDIDVSGVDVNADGEISLDELEAAYRAAGDAATADALALAGHYADVNFIVSQDKNHISVDAVVNANTKYNKKGGGGGGGGKSAVDKLIEEQKRRLAELEHESKMLSIEEKGYDYDNDYSGWHDNIQDQISLQEQLREAYKQNIQELENMLAKTKEGSDDWYKLKDAIYAAKEALAEVSNTINELNLKNISILSDEMEDADKFSNHVINMLDKRAQQALSEDRFQNYEQLTERKIQETKDQRSQNNMEILRWKDYAQEKLNAGEISIGDDAWNEILNKIWELDEENAELDKSITDMELELNEQRLSQIAKVTQENLQTATHNNNLASMYGNVYESLGYRKGYETMITEQMSNNEKLIAENTKAKEAVKEEMATLVEGSTAWFNAQAALYQYDEALAQTNISQMELNHALEESKMQGIAETYEDWTRDLTHVNDLLSEEIDLFKETGDTKAQKKALQMYISNEDEMITAKKQSLADLNKQLAEGLAAGTLDPAMQRALLDEINTVETDILKMENDKLRKQREIDKIDLDKMLTDQNWESSEYSHNMQLVGYQSSKYQNAGELTNYGKMLKADIGLREQRTGTLKEEIAALKEQAQYYRDKYGPGTAEEKEITEQIMKREEELEKENTEIKKNNKLLEENADKIRKVRKSLEDTVDKQIEDEKKRQREILSANVSLQDTIVNLLRQRLQKEWELKKKDIEKEKESLNEYKKLINERFNYRRKAADQADKEEELAEYRRQLALIEVDPTRTKDAKELRRKIADMEKEQAWNLAEEELNAENERIDEQVTGMDKFVQYNEELLNEILGDANNFSAEMNTILTDSFEESYNNILEFMKKENEAFMKSLPDAQKQMIQSWEDTTKKAYDIIDTNYPEIQDILVSEESYIEYMKKYDQNYRKALEGNDTNYMEILERQYRENYQSLIRALKDDAEFEVHEHDLGEVKSKEGELDDELFEVDTKEITGEPAYTPEFDDSAVTAQDFSEYMDLVLESLDGIYKAVAPTASDNSSDGSSSTTTGGSTPGGSGGKYTAYAVAAYYDSTGLKSVTGKGTGNTQEEANKAAAEDAKSKIPTGHSLYAAGSGVYTPSDNGSVTLDDVTGLASVSTADKEKAFGIENRGESSQPTTSSHGYTISFNGQTYTKSGFDTKSEAERAASAELSRLRNNVQKPAGMPSDAFEQLKKSGSYTAYKKGGLVDYTGPAWVDGSKTRPEAFLDANDTESIRTMLNAFNYVKTHPYMSHIDSSMYGNNTSVGDINITINQAELKSDADYDAVARKVGQAFSKQLSRQGLNLSGYAF